MNFSSWQKTPLLDFLYIPSHHYVYKLFAPHGYVYTARKEKYY